MDLREKIAELEERMQRLIDLVRSGQIPDSVAAVAFAHTARWIRIYRAFAGCAIDNAP